MPCPFVLTDPVWSVWLNSHFHLRGEKKEENKKTKLNMLLYTDFIHGEESTQIFALISFFLSFSHVNEYPCIFKCEIYCRGILNFNCNAFNRTLCALIT